MELWFAWQECVMPLREACSRLQTFLWMYLVIAAMSTRGFDMVGVTSFVRCHWIKECYYYALLRLFHSSGVNLDGLTAIWTRICIKLFQKFIYTVNGRHVLLADGIKAPKEGRKMPAVKSLHQQSNCNAKAPLIMGHSCQVVSMVIHALDSFFALPLAGRIHEGLRLSNRNKKTLLDKLIALIAALKYKMRYYLVADSYYASKKIARPLIADGNHLLTRLKTNAVAYTKAAKRRKKGKGRHKFYGQKFKLSRLFKNKALFTDALSPVYNDYNITIQYRKIDLLWRPLGIMVRFVLVIHPKRGRIVLMTTDISLDPLTIIKLYGLRYKIEAGFKQAVHTIGTFNYHFWMKDMNKIKRGSGDQFLHKKSPEYRQKVTRKMKAYETHIQLGLITQGILQYLSVLKPEMVWDNFNSWMRTMRTDQCPSEHVVSLSLSCTLPQFLLSTANNVILKKFILPKLDTKRFPLPKSNTQ
jgi:hypothetical protein